MITFQEMESPIHMGSFGTGGVVDIGPGGLSVRCSTTRGLL